MSPSCNRRRDRVVAIARNCRFPSGGRHSIRTAARTGQQFHLLELERVGDVNGQDQTFTSVFILAGRTRTQTAEHRANVATLVPVRPTDHQVLGIQFLDLHRIRRTGARGHLLHLQNGRIVVLNADLCGQTLGDLPQHDTAGRFGLGQNNWHTGIRLSSNRKVQRNLPQKRNVECPAARRAPPSPKMWSLESQ